MTSWQHVQRDFSGGEISGRMLMRSDTEVYRKSAIGMINYMPMPQGSAMRMPGTRFYEELEDLNARIIPYLTSGNERSLIVLTPEGLRLIRNVTERIEDEASWANIEINGTTITYRKNIVQNSQFRQGKVGWTFTPEQYTGVNGDGPLGVYIEESNGGSRLALRPRLYRYPSQEEELVMAEATAEVDVGTDVITLNYRAVFADQPEVVLNGGYTFKVIVSANSDYSSPLYEETYNEVTNPSQGSTFEVQENVDLPTADWTGTLYIKFTAEATATDDQPYSNPLIKVNYFQIYADGETTLTEADLSTSYTAADLDDIQYVQSPYADKEIVFTHSRHEPSKLYFNTGGGSYTFEAISFTGTPSEWGTNNYPAACTSYLGRLVLAGAQTFKTASGDPVATVSETVWMTDPGDWSTFTTTSPVAASDSIKFTAIYRSPIQWVYGARSLLVGSLEYEYSVRGEGILAPGDIGVFLQTTHGSTNVQPAAFGEGLLFPADGGTKVRSLSYRDETQGWVAADLTLFNPAICNPKIKRMVRMRNPHQMCVVLKTDGTLAVFHSESGLNGWCRYKLEGGIIRDICVVPDSNGTDVLFMTVERDINGEKKLYLECIPNWRETRDWDFTQSTKHFNFETPTDTITGLDHLEGKIVQVKAPGRYIGFFKVVNGSITLTIGTGFESSGDITVTVTSCTVGLGHRSVLTTLPPGKMDPGAEARFADYGVRTLGSTRPIINGYRPSDRNPMTIMDVSQPLDLFNDIVEPKFGWDPYQVITIEEHLPFFNEILGVYGKLKQGSIK